jgi:hypothetical protein
MRVISGHLGWVRALAVDPSNEWFASGAGDRLIKVRVKRWTALRGFWPKWQIYLADLGFGVWNFEALFDGPHFHRSWNRDFRQTSLSLFMWRGQDDQVLGLGTKQGHTTLSRTFERDLLHRPPPDSGCTCHRRARLHSAGRSTRNQANEIIPEITVVFSR